MRLRHGSILNAPMVIALMAFAVVAFLLLIDTAIMPPKSTKNTNATTANQNSNTGNTTDGTFLTNTNSGSDTNSSMENSNSNSTGNTNTTTSTSQSSNDDWKASSGRVLGVTLEYPGDMQMKTCSERDMLFVTPASVTCETEWLGPGFSLTRQPADYNQSTTIEQIKADIQSPTVTATTVDGYSATRVAGVTKTGDGVYGGGGRYTDYIFLTVGQQGYTINDLSTTQSPYRADDFAAWLETVDF